MKKIFFLFLVCFFMRTTTILHAQGVAVNANKAAPNASAMLDVQSTTKGMLIPRMTTAQRTAIASPATGLLVFDNSTGSFWFKNAAGWIELTDSTNNFWKKAGTNVYVTDPVNVGVGTNTPSVKLQIEQGSDATATGGGFLQLGKPSAANLALDNNEIQARNNGSAADISIQAGGGNVGIGTKNPAVKLQVSNGTDASAASGGYLQLGAASVANLAFDNNEMQARTNGAATDLYMQVGGGNVGIGTGSPTTKLEIDHGTDVTFADGGYLQLGTQSLQNLGLDNNEIQARNAGLPSALYLQNKGGALQIGSANAANITDVHINNGKLINPTTGNANLLPLCYGHVSSNGSLISGTSNVSITKGNAGQYYIHCSGITSSTIMTASANDSQGGAKLNVSYKSAGQAYVLVVIGDTDPENRDFSFVFYNP